MTIQSFRTHATWPAGPVRHIASALATCLLLAAACGKDAPAGGTPDSARRDADVGADSAATVRVGDKPTEEHGEEHGEAESGRVELTEASFATARIVVQPVVTAPAQSAGEALEVPGQVDLDPRRIALVSPRISGRIERLSAVEGDRVVSGQAVAHLYSPEHLTAQADLTQAERRARLLAGTPDESGARALADAARRRLRLMGVTAGEIARVAAGGEPAATLALRAPLTGSVMQSHAIPGAAVEAGAPVFTVADLSVVDVVAEVPEASLPLVRVGQAATIGIAAYPGMRFQGDVERLRDALNPETRTVRAVIHVPNPGRTLRPGMFANVRLRVSARDAVGAEGSILTIPEAAIVTDGERRFVFVEVAPRTFERREVRVAPLAPVGSSATRSVSVAVLDGLRAGERVVVSGAFTLKSELAKSSLSDEH